MALKDGVCGKDGREVLSSWDSKDGQLRGADVGRLLHDDERASAEAASRGDVDGDGDDDDGRLQ